MKKKIFVFILSVVLIFSFSIFSSADSYPNYNVPMSQPNVSDTVGYIELWIQEPDSSYYGTTIVFTIPEGSYVDIQMSAHVMKIQCINPNGENLTMGSYYVDSIRGQGVINGNVFGELEYDYNLSIITGYHIYAGFRFITNVTGVGQYPFTIEYGTDSRVRSACEAIVSLLENSTSSGSLSAIEENTRQSEELLDSIVSDSTSASEQSHVSDGVAVSDDYRAQEQVIVEGSSDGRTETSNIFSEFGSLFDGRVSRALLGFVNLISSFVGEVPILGTLVRFSLSLGMFSFLVGSANSILDRRDSAVRRERFRRMR